MSYMLCAGQEFKAFIRFNNGQTHYFKSEEAARAHWAEFSSVIVNIGGVKTATLYLISEVNPEKLK